MSTYATIEEVYGNDFYKKKRKTKKIRNRKEEDISQKYAKNYQDMRKKTENDFHLLSEKELEKMPEKSREVLGYDIMNDDDEYLDNVMHDDLKKFYDYEEDPVIEEEEDEDAELDQYLEKRFPTPQQFEEHKEDKSLHVKEYFKSNDDKDCYYDILLYGLSGVLLIFMMENLIKIGKMMK